MSRKKITTINHYDVLSVSHGGTHAILDFYYELSRWYDVNIIMLVNSDIYVDMLEYSNGVKIYPLYYNQNNTDKSRYDYIIDELPKNDEVVDRIRTISADSELIISEHVYTWNLVKAASAEQKRIYRSHNVEYDYMRMVWDISEGDSKLNRIYHVENDACKNADLVLTIGENDRIRMINLYRLNDLEQRKIITIGAGFAQNTENIVLPSERRGIQGYKYSAVYIASKTAATIEAVKTIISIAIGNTDVTYLIAGSVCSAFVQSEMPRNVVLKGFISDSEKNHLLSQCDFAINPVEDGAGVNIKMLEFFSAGIPVITSAHGIRGIDAINGREVIITKGRDYGNDIDKFLELSFLEKDLLAKNARRLFDESYSWKSIANKAKTLLCQYMNLNEVSCIEPVHSFENNIGVFNVSDEVYIRGAGIRGKDCLSQLKNNGVHVKAFIDKHKNGEIVDGIPVINLTCMDYKTHIVIAISEYEEVHKELIEVGVEEKYIILYIGRSFISFNYVDDASPKYIDKKKLRNIC